MNKITIIGNSVTLRVRPPVINNKVYGKILEEELNNNDGVWFVNNQGLGRWDSSEFYINEDKYLQTFPNYFILNIGCVDAPNREIPHWFSKIILLRNNSFLYKVFNFFYKKTISKSIIRRTLTIMRKKSWIDSNEFKKNISYIINLIKKETNAEIIILGINKGNDRIENALPGTIEKYKSYNSILIDICEQNSIQFVNTRDLSSEDYYPDGIHFNQKGHDLIAKRLLKIITK